MFPISLVLSGISCKTNQQRYGGLTYLRSDSYRKRGRKSNRNICADQVQTIIPAKFSPMELTTDVFGHSTRHLYMQNGTIIPVASDAPGVTTLGNGVTVSNEIQTDVITLNGTQYPATAATTTFGTLSQPVINNGIPVNGIDMVSVGTENGIQLQTAPSGPQTIRSQPYTPISKFNWRNLRGYVPAIMHLVDSHNNLVNGRLPLRCGTKYYFAIKIDGMYYTLKVIDCDLVFSATLPDCDAVYFEVPSGHMLTTNDVRLKNFLKVDSDFLVDRFSINMECVKFYISPYTSRFLPASAQMLEPQLIEDYDHIEGRRYCEAPVPNPNGRIVIVGPNCEGKGCVDDNGCGRPCGCLPGSTCNTSTNRCVSSFTPIVPASIPVIPACPPENTIRCGINNCPGMCDNGQLCTQNANGTYTCVAEATSFWWWFWVALIFIIFVILIGWGVYYYSEPTTTIQTY